MKLATIHVAGVQARPADLMKIPRGITGAVVAFRYEDDAWAGLTKNVVFDGAVTVTVANAGEEVVFPAEVASREGVSIRVGIVGVSEDGSVAFPTLWAELGVVQDSPVNGFPPAEEQASPFWAQLQQDVNQLSAETDALAEKVANLEAGADSGAGGSSTAGVVDISVTEDADGVVTMVNTLEGGGTETLVVTPDANGNPSKLTYNGIEIPITWTEAADEEEST